MYNVLVYTEYRSLRILQRKMLGTHMYAELQMTLQTVHQNMHTVFIFFLYFVHECFNRKYMHYFMQILR
jgi:hypothetical protein